MVMTEDEIASAAARRSAARRKRVTKHCERCGTEFEGLTTRRYCSDRCRVDASRQRDGTPRVESTGERSVLADLDLEPRDGEPAVDYFDRVRNAIMRGRVFTDDSTEIVRQSRIERTNELMQALGWDDLVEQP